MQKHALIDYWKDGHIVTDEAILEAFRKVPRQDFVPIQYKEQAYDDYPLPIGHGQTISQPTTVAIMTQALEPRLGQKILEVGTGSGYQAAILSHLVGRGKVLTTEIISKLADTAEKTLGAYSNVTVLLHDGSIGYSKEAPYDRIIVTAACRHIPMKLVDQLKEGGIIVAPVGREGQTMIKGVKHDGELKTEELGAFVFVPLTGRGA